MRKTQVPVEVKATEGEGRFTALAAVFDVLDTVGDIMKPGSFTETLRKWRESGKRIPIVWSHKTDTPDMVIGSADPDDVTETTSGLLVEGKLDIEESSGARRVWQLLKSGAVSGWSFGYITKKQRRQRDANNIYEVELLELGPTVNPANAATATIGVKGIEEDEPASDAELREKAVSLGVIADEKVAAQHKSQGPIHIARFEV
jgi:HK97 family phage prohead protease